MKKLGIKEELELEITNLKMQKIEEEKELKREDLIALTEIGAIMENYDIPAEGEYKDYFFEIDENYKVTVLDKVRGEKPNIDANIISSNSKITAEIEVTASISEGTIASIEATNGATLKESAENTNTKKIFTVNKNGTYYFKAKADNGRSAVKIVTVNTLLDAPKISIKNIGAYAFTITIDNNYEEGIVSEYKYYVNGNTVNTGTTNKEYVVTGLNEETEYNNIFVEAYLVGETIPIRSEIQKVTTAQIKREPINLRTATITGDTSYLEDLEDEGIKMSVASSDATWLEKKIVVEGINLSDYSKIEIDYSGDGGMNVISGSLRDNQDANFQLFKHPDVTVTTNGGVYNVPRNTRIFNIPKDKIYNRLSFTVSCTARTRANLCIYSINLIK